MCGFADNIVPYYTVKLETLGALNLANQSSE